MENGKKRVLIIAIVTILLALGILGIAMTFLGNETKKESQVETVMEELANWESRRYSKSLDQAGTPSVDWYVFAMSRGGFQENYPNYREHLSSYVKECYQNNKTLSLDASTEYHRISLALLAAGGNPENVEGRNLIAEGTYYREQTASLNRQGIIGWIWACITLSTKDYEIPADADTTKEEIISEILAYQTADGGFSMGENQADPDITAMVIQALAMHTLSIQSKSTNEKSNYALNEYTYVNRKTDQITTKSIETIIEEALDCLATLQLSDGSFGYEGEPCTESTAQVLVALSCRNLDPTKEKRFLKGKQNVLTALMEFQNDDGGFPHMKGEESDGIAGSQALYALSAWKRCKEGQPTIYNFR